MLIQDVLKAAHNNVLSKTGIRYLIHFHSL